MHRRYLDGDPLPGFRAELDGLRTDRVDVHRLEGRVREGVSS